MTQNYEQKSGVCIHGALRRKCETCDLADRLDAAEARVKALEKVAEAAKKLLADLEIGDDARHYGVTITLHAALAALSAAPPGSKEPK